MIQDENGVTFFPDTNADTVTINGTSAKETFLISAVDKDSNNRMTHVRVVNQGVLTVNIANSVMFEGDNLKVDGQGGGDTLDASGLGNPNPNDTTTIYPFLIGLYLKSGGTDTASATLIGGPFNETLEGGSGADTFVGGGALDVFIDPTSNNTLIETHNSDMSLFGNKFVWGQILARTALARIPRVAAHRVGIESLVDGVALAQFHADKFG